jgi:uncharacterized protein with von Willebrand factor type A (vWA) domain
VSRSALRTAVVDSAVVDRLTGFAELLRQRGIAVGAHELSEAMRTLCVLDLSDHDALYWGLRLTMVRDGQHLDAFDEAFRDFWWSRHTELLRIKPQELPSADDGGAPAAGPDDDVSEEEPEGGTTLGVSLGRRGDADDEPEGEDDEAELQERAAYSDLDVIGHKNFADYSPDDHRRLIELLASFQNPGPMRVSRRKRPDRGGALDIRRTVRAGFRTEGHPVRQLHRRQQLKPRRLTFVCDVSGSMEHYSRAVLELAHVATVSRRRVEAFAFATHLTRLTRELLERDPAAAVTHAMEAVVDWSGGTRVGDCVAELNRTYRAALHGAVVVIASDGWDLGDPEQLSAEAALLHRVAHRVIWVNPQLQDPAFEPLTRGMSAALPHVDDFISCHNFVSFMELIELLDRI